MASKKLLAPSLRMKPSTRWTLSKSNGQQEIAGPFVEEELLAVLTSPFTFDGQQEIAGPFVEECWSQRLSTRASLMASKKLLAPSLRKI